MIIQKLRESNDKEYLIRLKLKQHEDQLKLEKN